MLCALFAIVYLAYPPVSDTRPAEGSANESSSALPIESPVPISEFGPRLPSSQAFSEEELPKQLFSIHKARHLAQLALDNWRDKKYELALEDCASCAKLLPRKDLTILALAAEAKLAARAHLQDKALILYLTAYNLAKLSNSTRLNEFSAVLFLLGNICNDWDSEHTANRIAEKFYERAIKIREATEGLKLTDAPSILRYAQMELALNQWETAQRILETWLYLFTSAGAQAPGQYLPEVLAELGRTCNNQNKFTESEQYYRRALEATLAFNSTTITPISHYDVKDLLIYTLLDQRKFQPAYKMANEQLELREKELGRDSAEFASQLKAYADKFESVGQAAFASKLRTQAAKTLPAQGSQE